MQHWSSCAVHNEPAMPAGPCDCGGYNPETDTEEYGGHKFEDRSVIKSDQKNTRRKPG